MKSIMASPPHDLVHTLVDKHGLQAVSRLMMKPRAHIAAPTAGLIRSTRSPSPGSTRETASSRKTATKFDSLPEAASISKILPSTLANNMFGNAATPPIGFALTTQQERRLYGPKPKRGALMPRTINETSSLLLHMRPIIVKRELSVRYSSQQRSAGSEESVESEQQRVVSPNLSATTTTSPSHTSASPHAPPCGHGLSPPSPLSVKRAICHRPAPSARSPTLPARQHVMAVDLDAVEALLSLTSRVPSAQEPLPSLVQSVAEDSQEFNETTGATSNHGAGSSCRSSPCVQSGGANKASLDEQGHDAATDSIISARFVQNAKSRGAPGLREASGNGLQHKRTPATRSYATQDADQSDVFPALPRMVPGLPTGVAVGSIEIGGVKEAGGHDKNDDNAAQLLLSAAATAAVTLESSLLSRRGRSGMEACGRGSYKCSRCGLPKKGHKCMLSPRDDVAGLLNRGVKADNAWLPGRASDKGDNSMPTTSSTSASTPVSSALSPSPELSSATTSDSEKLFEGGRGRRQEGREAEDRVCVRNCRRAGRRAGSRKGHGEEAHFVPAQLEGSRKEAVALVPARALSSSPPPLGSSGGLVASSRGKRAVSSPPRRSRSPVDKKESACADDEQRPLDDRGGIQLTGSIGSDLQGPAGQRRKRRRKNHCSFFLPGGVKAYDGGHSHEDRFASAPAARTDSAKAKDDVAGASSSPSMVGVSVGVPGKTSLLSSQMALFLAGCSSATSARACKDRGNSGEKSDDEAP